MESTIDQSSQIRSMFNQIAHRYDFLNRFLSLGLDCYWRRTAVRCLAPQPGWHICDLATGTADVALEIAGRMNPGSVRIEGIDFCTNMLALARKKIKTQHQTSSIRLFAGAAESLPYRDGLFNGMITAFGVRNFADLQAGLGEMYRVLKPAGRLVVLEFSLPLNSALKTLYTTYFNHILPRIGGWVSGHSSAYKYLPASVSEFPVRDAFSSLLEREGFSDIEYKDLTFGIVTIYTATKP